MSWCAYLDESEPDRRYGPGTYVLAAALIEREDEEEARAAVAALRLRGQRKLHWHDEDRSRRKLLTEAIAAARRAGASWTVIGAAAGLARRSAYQRWSPNSDRAAKTRSVP